MKIIILAGGSGSRLWPVSRSTYPKFLISINNDDSLLQQTVKRLVPNISPSDILTITNKNHAIHTKAQLDALYLNMPVLNEPISKNTAPAIACGCKYWEKITSPDDVIAILPSDHHMDSFYSVLEKAEKLALKGYIVTLGKKPTKPETSFGYIKVNHPIDTGYKCEKFVEKPDRKTAEVYYNSDNYFWNCGIFIAQIKTFLSEFKEHAPEIFRLLNDNLFNQNSIDMKAYEQMPNISMDYAIMEKSDKIVMLELESDWDDLGSWEAVYNTLPSDTNRNVCIGPVITHNTYNCLGYSVGKNKMITLVDVENIVVVDTPDAVLVCHKEKTQNVKNAYEKIKKISPQITQIHTTVLKPWGSYTNFDQGKGYLVKTLSVNPQAQLSVQSHQYRSEHWTVLQGSAVVILNEKEYILNKGESIDIPLGAKHSCKNITNTVLKILETQKGDILSEDDIIRYQDIYGRV